MAYTTINKSSDHFNTVLYTGDGSASDRTITGVGFQPDFLWNKSRSNAYNHYIFDVLRGTNMISSNATTAQEDKSPQFSAFTSDGFTIRNDAGSLAINASGVTFANWCWKANGAGVSNTDGSITSTVSANTTSGFSIVKYTGTGSVGTIGHGLSAVPKMIIVKRLDSTSSWSVYHSALGNANQLYLNTTDASTSSTGWNSTDPTSSVFSIGSTASYNGSGNTYIAYAFAEKSGFSSMGSYVGNGNADGTFVYTGFKPAFILLKNTTLSVENWVINDSGRNPSNIVDKDLFANQNYVEAVHSRQDFLSNGFKLRSTANNSNKSGDTYIYMCFAESPLVSSNGVPAVAR